MNCNQNFRVKRYLEKYEESLCIMERKMLGVKIKENITKNFIECMIPHHKAAICISENILQYVEYEPIKDIANNIIKIQTDEIQKMNEINDITNGYDNSQKDIRCYREKYCDIVNLMLYKMKRSPRSLNICINYINEMIHHHEGAINMCENLLAYYIDPRIKDVAESMIKNQKEEVNEYKKMISKLY